MIVYGAGSLRTDFSFSKHPDFWKSIHKKYFCVDLKKKYFWNFWDRIFLGKFQLKSNFFDSRFLKNFNWNPTFFDFSISQIFKNIFQIDTKIFLSTNFQKSGCVVKLRCSCVRTYRSHIIFILVRGPQRRYKDR